MKRTLYKLARERLLVAEEAFTKGFYNSSASELYFALFTLMRYILSEHQAGGWKHIGIFEHFSGSVLSGTYYQGTF
ncbi:MAG: hypothetical protein KNN13_04655 [Hydrogenobacter thermophilus]|uniref:hypothetical protein n=1 Tax=Hydrogenobacter thermophilus TaxID=940 RepID=UPI001C78FC49|nr:hypothetical protein [Hydrogenobacter thermophilus]QWK20612.1 MAG: hypothetical protein KNN13_04655 [Hydrogenobacter thermophilus]